MTIAFNSTTESGFIKNDFDQISAYLSGADDSTTLETRLDGLDTTDGNLNTAINNLTTTVSSQRIHRKVYSSAAEETVTGNTSFNDTSKTFNLTAPIGSLIIGINITASLKHTNNNGHSRIGLKISGTNLGNLYGVSNDIFLYRFESAYSLSNTITTVESFLLSSYGTNYKVVSTHLNKSIKVLDANTTFTLRLSSGSSTESAYIKDVVIEVIYVESFVED